MDKRSIEIDQDVYDEVVTVCHQLGTTVESMVESFIRFCVIPENLPLLKTYIDTKKAPAEAGAKAEIFQKVFDKVFAIASEETIMRGLPGSLQH